eukprot:3978108-Prymnesium_polylepis.1
MQFPKRVRARLPRRAVDGRKQLFRYQRLRGRGRAAGRVREGSEGCRRAGHGVVAEASGGRGGCGGMTKPSGDYETCQHPVAKS